MTRQMLCRIATECWGRSWVRELALATGYHHDTVRKWSWGRYPIRRHATARILQAALAHSRAKKKHVTQMVAGIKQYEKSERKRKALIKPMKKKRKNPIPPWKRPPGDPEYMPTQASQTPQDAQNSPTPSETPKPPQNPPLPF